MEDVIELFEEGKIKRAGGLRSTCLNEKVNQLLVAGDKAFPNSKTTRISYSVWSCCCNKQITLGQHSQLEELQLDSLPWPF